ncbi:hypothetical protein BASA81_010371 [Batrachochytrium salamandrivorans]|nr:hypothetical protein BASA81_010371 [Batrachochytrium salamandrivorans]
MTSARSTFEHQPSPFANCLALNTTLPQNNMEGHAQRLAVLIAFGVLARQFWRKANRISNEKGRVAVVTGAAGGVGKEAVLQLVEQGWQVFACDVDANGLEKAAFPKTQVTTITFDIRRPDQCQALVDQVSQATNGRLDALLNIAGVVQPGPIMGFSEEQIKFVYEVNTFGPMRLCSLFIPLLIKGRFGGSIINLASIGSKIAWPWSGNYSATKAALLSFSDALRRESLANALPLRVSVVAPGPIKTPMAHLFTERMNAWVAGNEANPFFPACSTEAKFQQRLKDQGFDQDVVAVLPEVVAAKCIDLLDDLDPDAFCLVYNWAFSLLYNACWYLPTRLGDRLLIAF